MKTNIHHSQPLACDLTAIPSSTRAAHAENARLLFTAAQEVHELTSGYALRFLNQQEQFITIVQFIEQERLCCPFFHFGLEIESYGGPLWLQLTGGEGVKEFLQTTLFGNLENQQAGR